MERALAPNNAASMFAAFDSCTAYHAEHHRKRFLFTFPTVMALQFVPLFGLTDNRHCDASQWKTSIFCLLSSHTDV